MKHPAYLVRQRVENSHDTEQLAARFGDRLHIVWVNDPDEIIFALKEAAASPAAIALQCDRVGSAPVRSHSSSSGLNACSRSRSIFSR